MEITSYKETQTFTTSRDADADVRRLPASKKSTLFCNVDSPGQMVSLGATKAGMDIALVLPLQAKKDPVWEKKSE